MSILNSNELSELKDKLADQQLNCEGLKGISATLKECSSSDNDFVDQRLSESAALMSQLIDLSIATNTDEESSVSLEIREYVRAHVDVILLDNDSDDFNRVNTFLANTREQFKEYLECFESDLPGLDGTEDQWFESDSDGCELLNYSAPESDELEVSETAIEQMSLMLAALGNNDVEGSTESEVVELNEAVSGQPRKQAEQPTDDFTELLEDADMCEAFLDDATRCLDSMEQCSLLVEQGTHDDDTLKQFCRELHTLKGASASVGMAMLAASIHDVESELELQIENPGEQTVELMLTAVDRVRSVIGQIKAPATTAQPEAVAAARNSMPNLSFGSNSADDSLIRIRASKLDRLMDMLAELVVLRNRRESHITEFADFNHELKCCASRLSCCADDKSNGPSTFLNSTGTLVEIAKDIGVLSDGIRELQSPVSKDNISISHFIRDFRQELMQLRRIPLSGLFNRIQRSARDVAKVEGKRLRFEIAGEDAGLERELQEKLYEPLLHIVRNAVSHGIELPASREQAGKSADGLIRLEARSNSQLLVIKVSDDGNGLDHDAIRRRAVEKGLILASQMIGQDELAKLIFHPGFSTRETTSQVSGRGVGMDVAMTAVEQMRGRIEIESEAGHGTSMIITVPMQTGIEHAMVFRSAGQLFALPMQSVARVQTQSEPTSEEVVSIATVLSMSQNGSDNGSELLFLRGVGDSFADSKGPQSSSHSGFAVDEILGPEEVVVRSLPALLKPHPLFCGLTLSGSGETVLLLDADRLVNFTRNVSSTSLNIATKSEHQNEIDIRLTTVLVVDDSLSARKLLSKKLVGYGFKVIEASDGLEGLEQIRNCDFDLVFTDLDMPRLGGMEMLSDLKQRGIKQNVVVVSSRSADQFGDLAIENGAIDYLTKPVDDRELKQILLDLQLIE